MFKAFAAAAIVSYTSALKTQARDIYGNPFNHPNEEVKTPTCTLKVHSVLPDLDVPKVPIKSIKKNGYDPYGIYDDFDPDLSDHDHVEEESTETGGDTMTSDDMTSGDMMTSDDMMTSADMMSEMMGGMDMMESSDMMSEMMGGMEEGNEMMSSAMAETKDHHKVSYAEAKHKTIAELVNQALGEATIAKPEPPVIEKEPVDPNAPKLTKEEWFALRKKRYLTHEEYALYKLGFIKEEEKKDEEMKSDEMTSETMTSETMTSDTMTSDDMTSDDMTSDGMMSSDMMSSEMMSSEMMSHKPHSYSNHHNHHVPSYHYHQHKIPSVPAVKVPSVPTGYYNPTGHHEHKAPTEPAMPEPAMPEPDTTEPAMPDTTEPA